MTSCSSKLPHPLAPLSVAEVTAARDLVAQNHGADAVIYYRSIFLHEPSRADLTVFLAAENAGKSSPLHRPARLADVQYDIISPKAHHYSNAVVDLGQGRLVEQQTLDHKNQPYFTAHEFGSFQDACLASKLFKEVISEFSLPEGFEITIDPWPYGSLDISGVATRYMQGLVFAKHVSNGNPDSNHYAYPIPIIAIMDIRTKEVIRIDRLATGGTGDSAAPRSKRDAPTRLFLDSRSAEYVPELLDVPLRNDLMPLDIRQPDGPSFKVHSDHLVEWQKWRFRISFTPREGAVLHDVCYEGRSILYRMSYSELTVPYADPRPPFHRKQAFDLGDGGFGRAANNLSLGCDCVGAVHYLDSLSIATDGTPTLSKAVVCLHEQDNGILWKHTNFRTGKAVVTRLRELVVQFIATLANYEYILAFKLDVAGGITVETRATGAMSVVAIDHGKTSPYGNVVAPGVLAQNHQHIFAIRIDPAIDSYSDQDVRVVVEDSVPHPITNDTNPYGNYYEVRREQVHKATWLDAEPKLNRVVRIENAHKQNDISENNVAYKLIPAPTQLLLADESSLQAKRAPFTQHHIWVTGHRDDELWAAGEFTNQSTEERGGVASMVKREDWFTDDQQPHVADGQDNRNGRRSSPVIWSVFGLTHNPRIEDWPVMPVEIIQIRLQPSDFFTRNPAIDMPSNQNKSSVLVPCCDAERRDIVDGRTLPVRVQEEPLTHLQGPDLTIDPKTNPISPLQI